MIFLHLNDIPIPKQEQDQDGNSCENDGVQTDTLSGQKEAYKDRYLI
jgi:hypothetical protein